MYVKPRFPLQWLNIVSVLRIHSSKMLVVIDSSDPNSDNDGNTQDSLLLTVQESSAIVDTYYCTIG